MNILDKMLTYCKIKDLQGKKLLLNFTHIHAKKSKINNYISIFVDNNEYVLEQQRRFYKDYYDYIFNINDFYTWLKNMPKFDVIIGNPPYEGKYYPLYLSILKTIKDFAKNIIWICPTKWTDCLKENVNFKDAIENMNPIFNQYIRLNNNVFENAIFDGDIAIYVFGAKKDNLYDLKWDNHRNKTLAKSIFEKLSTFNLHLSDFCHKDYNKKFYVRGTRVRGNYGSWDWTTMFGTDQMTDFSKKNISWSDNFWNFDTINECKNFIDFCNSDIIMYSLYLVKYGKNNNQGELGNMPWFDDYTKQWSEKEIAKKLKLTKEEVDYIHQEMKNFGWKTKGKK